jgi:hypothetical protein
MRFKFEVQTGSSDDWNSNSQTFDRSDQAVAAAIDLQSRWTLVTNWRVVPVETAVETN